jgi:enterochelin esterase-like enzyme
MERFRKHLNDRKRHLAFVSILVTAACWIAPASAQVVTIQENTVGFCGVEGTVDSNHSGFTGSGFANSNNATGAGVNWTVSVPASGNYALEWRYANGSANNRPGSLRVNGSSVATVNFPSTGAWTSWTVVSANIALSAGENKLRLQATASEGLANIDALSITGNSPQAADCGGSSSLSCVADPTVQRFTSIPQQFWQSPANAGTMQKVSYPVHYYTTQTSGGPGDLPRQSQAITKQFNIYLPYNYRADRTYPLVVVLHGITDNEDTWIGSRSSPRPKAMLDALIAAGEIQPMIVVFPNACSSSNFNNCGFNNQAGYYYFDNELVKDLIPFLESHYSVTTSRGCRGLAGFSMGGMQTINLGMCRNLQHFASFAPFAAAPTTYRASQVAQCLAAQNQQASYPINFFYNTHGASDGTAGASHRAAIEGLDEMSPYISSTNFAYHTVPGGHDYPPAMIGLFNFLRTAFPN